MANLEFFDTHCCALEEIHNLAPFEGDPKAAMISFCKSNLGRPVEWKIRMPSGGDFGRAGALFSFYFFGAAVYSSKKTNYGAQFAKFIEEEGLGSTITTPALTNKAYHEDHANQIWIWMPDVKALNKWWEKNQPPKGVRNRG